jgi:DNA-binding response OmpR family regulator
LNGSTTSAAVVVDANTRRANQVASLIGELGFLAEVAGTGREGFRIASERMDIELILLHVNTIRWPLSATVANLRADARTASIPIVVYGPDSLRSRLSNLVHRHPPMVYVIEASASQELDAQLRPSLAKWRGQEPTDQQRAQQRATAAYSDNVLLALSAIPSADVQSTLHEITLGRSFEMTTRESAARQLAHHIQQYGLLLSRGQVVEVKAAWQTSTDPNLGSALAAVLGSLRPNAKQVGVRFREFAQPTPPTQ